ncbi:flagellar type III secretion system pore protein FliP [Dissulfurirhabdus thermomarina]|uniref:Flagellar biosynthetic protein FliP n=1 Tax=Dissulfurirhabdus thermomarina TaxID=1765737 RepID=A0A6N9TN37_DISTH|nr:flagellar type III secretion system pore protein FliP [Dissulfurirhabdus thermomarina]NDY42712.1 flagellar type III secretion system pore protein FliP [Dissulfurirhabdus thermomarina]NMX24465.1 flagellar type III secretion system pore protein FliP [Dissulfurirhabdus thermomarina]
MTAARRLAVWLPAALAAAALLGAAAPAWAVNVPTVQLGVEGTDDPGRVATALEIVFLLTVLSVAPAILLMTTSFTRLAVVFGFLRQAIGTQQMPPNQVLIGLALFLTFFIMQPTWSEVNRQAVQPYLNEEIGFTTALERAQGPLRAFMFRQTRQKDIALFVETAKVAPPRTPDDVPTMVLIPAFMVSELKTAFQIGFLLYIPFLIIDMVVASVLLSMGMMMLPPILISLPFKLLLFVLVDGWNLIVGSLVRSFF